MGLDLRDEFFKAVLRLTSYRGSNADSFYSKVHSKTKKFHQESHTDAAHGGATTRHSVLLSLCAAGIRPAQPRTHKTRANLQNKALLIFLWAERIKSVEPSSLVETAQDTGSPSVGWDNEPGAVIFKQAPRVQTHLGWSAFSSTLRLLSCLVCVFVCECVSDIGRQAKIT